MEPKLLADSVASIRKALEEFLTPSLRELRSETHMDIAEVRSDVDRLRGEVDQLRGESAASFTQVRAEIGQVRSETLQFREETAANFGHVRGEISGLRSDVSALSTSMERGFAEINAKLDLQADVQRLKEQVASLQASQQARAVETH